MTKAELRADVYRRLEEVTGSPVYVSQADVDDALHDGYLEISDATEWREVYRTVDLCASRPYYDLRTLFGADLVVLRPLGAFHEDTNRWLTPISPRDLDGGYARWEQVIGPPDRLFTRGLFWIAYYPAIGSDSGTVKQYLAVLPDALDDEDAPGFDEDYHPALVEYALAEILPQIGEVTAAVAAWDAYTAYERALAAHMQNRGSVARQHGYQ